MDTELYALAERFVIAVEKIADRLNAEHAPSVREPMTERTRETLLKRYEGTYITVDQAREELGMINASSKAVGAVLTAAGFERKRWSTGIRFAICEPGGTCVGAPVTLPDNLEESVIAARVAREKHGKTPTIQGIIYGAYLMQGVTAKPTQVTPAHIEEVKRRYPEFAE